MKKILASMFMVIVVCLSFAGCGLKNGAASTDPAIGNGGLAVAKGEWLYFANGYQGKSENFDNNKQGKVTKSGIYRIKTKDASYTIEPNNGEGQTNEPILAFNHGSITSDENGNIAGAELVVSHKVGFENGGFYIFGNYIYYATPGNRYDRKPETQRLNDVDFYRVKLNGEGTQKIYSVADYTENGKYAFYESGNDVYGVIYNGGKDFTVTKNASKLFTKTDVKEAVIPTINKSFAGQKLDNDNLVYFTTDSGKKLNQYKIGAKESEEISVAFNADASLMKVYKNELYYINNGAFYKYGTEKKLFYTNVTTAKDIQIINENLFIEKTATDLVKHMLTGTSEIMYNKSVEMLFVSGDNLYFIEESKIYALNLNDTSKAAQLISGESEIKTDLANKVSFDGSHIYYFKKWINKSNVECFYLEQVNLVGDHDKVSVASKIKEDYPPEKKEEDKTNP